MEKMLLTIIISFSNNAFYIFPCKSSFKLQLNFQMQKISIWTSYLFCWFISKGMKNSATFAYKFIYWNALIHYRTFAEEETQIVEEVVEKPEEATEVEAEIIIPTEEAPAAPKFTIVLEDVKVKEGKPAQFVAKATGQPTPKITWYHEKEPIEDGEIYKIK